MEEKQEKAVRFVKERLGELRKCPTYSNVVTHAEVSLNILDEAFPETKEEMAIRLAKTWLGKMHKRPTYGDTMISAELLLHILDTAFPEIKAWEDISDRDN